MKFTTCVRRPRNVSFWPHYHYKHSFCMDVSISVSGSLIELVAHTANCAYNGCGNSPASQCQKLASVFASGRGTGAANGSGNGNRSKTQNGTSTRTSNGTHWWPLSPWSDPSAGIPLQPLHRRCIRPGRTVLVAASSCGHLTIFAMALIGNGNFIRPQTVLVSFAPARRKSES